MTGPSRIKTGVPAPSEDAQSSETAGAPLAWQRELDVAIADIETRLSHPRRRVSDVQPTLPQLGQPEISSELIDEIAWRVSELLRRDGVQPPASKSMAGFISESITTPLFVSESGAEPTRPPLPPPPPLVESRQLPHGVALAIRIRRPFFRWPFRRRRKRAMITFADYRVT